MQEEGKTAEAVAQFEEALALDISCADAALSLGDLHRRAGRATDLVLAQAGYSRVLWAEKP